MATESDVSVSWLDRSGEITRTKFHSIGPGVGGVTYVGMETGISLIMGAMVPLSKLTHLKTQVNIPLDTNPRTLPVAADAQREWAIRFTYSDNVTGKLYRFDVPAPIDAVVQDGTDVIDMANALVIAFKAAFDLDGRSEVDNPVTLISGRIVGRRS